jgi:hypothetical protein
MMNATLPTAPCPESPARRDPPSPGLPNWEQLPAARQRELVLTLASLLVKRLPSQRPTPPEVRHE